ncbi:Peroxidase 44 [Dichanthelium oligosanthes]|uniref:peroxidase n=1 Tax=Dichanthelium oligosanthes TaxID=888268 RepID=A0A1E5WNL1_9POAL|nr:Peroxidase 44 [Dichanthelium oligosanthes]
MDARLVIVLLLAAAASAPLASAQLDRAFYKTTCPDAEKVIFDVVQKRFKQDSSTAAGLLRLVFHDCFANGCDASILIDPLSNQASEKEAGPNISVRGYDVIEEIKTELEKKCPGVVSCADIVATSARDAVRLTGGPAYEVPMGRRDSLVSNREDADGLPGPDIAVPKLIDEFAKQGFSLEEMIAMLAGGHSIGICRCFFIEADAAPIDPEYRKNISAACDGKDSGNVPMDFVSPNVFDGSYFALALAKKMPLTIDRLVGMDPKTEPVLKAMEAKPTDFVPLFAKAMEKLSVLKVLTGKDGEIRKSCSEFNTPQPAGGSSVIRTSSLNPDLMSGLAQPGAKPAVADARKVGGRADIKDPAIQGPGGELEAKRLKNAAKILKTNANEAAAKVEGGVVVSNTGKIQPPTVVPINQQPPNIVPVIPPPIIVPPIGGEINKDAGVQAAGQVPSKVAAGDEPASKLPGAEVTKAPKLRRTPH